MSSSALAALLGKKTSAPSATPTLASVTVATPVAPPAAAPTPPPTPAPAPAVAPSSSAPATPANSSASAVAAPAVFAPGPNAVPAGSAGVAPPDTLAALLGDFTAAAGKAPRVNPPQAAAVLAGATAREVAGYPEPPEVVEPKVAPVAKPADVLAAEQAPKSRRTAAVVQAELDTAMTELAKAFERIAQLEAQLAGGPAGEPSSPEEDLTSQAVELIEQLRAEAVVSLEDNRKAWARVAVLESDLEKVVAGAQRLEGFEGTPIALGSDLSLEEACAGLASVGFEVTLRYVGVKS